MSNLTVAEYIQQVLATAPVLDDEKRDTLTKLFAGGEQ